MIEHNCKKPRPLYDGSWQRLVVVVVVVVVVADYVQREDDRPCQGNEDNTTDLAGVIRKR